MADPNTNTETTPPAGGQQAATVIVQPTQEKTFTQAQLEEILKDRLGRVESKYADYNDLKAKAEALESATKSELEKATDRANKAEARATEKEREAKQTANRLTATTLAGELGFDAKLTDKVLRLVDINDDSTADSLRKSLEALAVDMPQLLAKKGAPIISASNPARTDTANDPAAKVAESRAALYGGRPEHYKNN